MANDMEKNIQDKDNIQYFSDTTYNGEPYNIKRQKFLVLLAFNNRIQHLLI